MIRQAREALAATLTPVGIAVHAYPPPVTLPPIILILPGTPYRAVNSLHGTSGDVSLEVQISVSSANPRSLDDYLDAAYAALLADPHVRPVASIAPPVIDQGVLVATIPTIIAWQE